MKIHPRLLIPLVLAAGLPSLTGAETIQNRRYDDGLVLLNRTNLVVRNCDIRKPTGGVAVLLSNCENVTLVGNQISRVGNEGQLMVENVSSNGFDFFPRAIYINAGLILQNSRRIRVLTNEIFDVFGTGIDVYADMSNRLVDRETLIQGNRIAYVLNDGIYAGVSDGPDPDCRYNIQGVVIRENVIHDVGLGLTRLAFARHGMYLGIRDVLVENNVVYNCFYGEGISLRNAGRVQGNRVWNCARGGISYWGQGRTEASSRKVVIENNTIHMDFAFSFPIRHAGFPETLHETVIGGIIFQYRTNESVRVDSVAVRSNSIRFKKDFFASVPLIVGNQDLSALRYVLTVESNRLVDQRKEKMFFSNLPPAVKLDRNLLLASSAGK